MPAKQQFESDPEQGPRKRGPKPKTLDASSAIDLGDNLDLGAQVARLQDSLDVLNDDMTNGFDGFGKAIAAILEGQGKSANSGNAQLLTTLARVGERVDLQCDRFDALLAALAICDRLPSRRFDQLMREVRKMAAKLADEQPKPAVKPMADWLLFTCRIVGMLVFVLAMVGIFALVGVRF